MSSSIAAASSLGRAPSQITDCFTTEAIRLEELLANHGVAARVGKAVFSPDAVRFPLQLGLGTTTRRLLGLSHSLARDGGYSHCRLRREGNALFLELPRDESVGLRYGDLLEREGDLPGDSALLGLMDDGASLMLHMTNPSVRHLLVSGDAGAGKSELLRVLGLGLASHHAARYWRLALLESNGGNPLAALRGLPHCWAWSEEPEHSVGWLIRLYTEMRRRERETVMGPRVLALLDDVERVLEVGGGVVRGVLRALLERGPESGVHLAVGCREEADLGELQPLFPARLSAGERQVPGRFRLHHEAAMIPLTTARLDDREVKVVVERLRFARPRVVAGVTGRDER